jgi:hypothetical protein
MRWSIRINSYMSAMGNHSVAEAKNRLPELIDRALKGESVVDHASWQARG